MRYISLGSFQPFRKSLNKLESNCQKKYLFHWNESLVISAITGYDISYPVSILFSQCIKIRVIHSYKCLFCLSWCKTITFHHQNVKEKVFYLRNKIKSSDKYHQPWEISNMILLENPGCKAITEKIVAYIIWSATQYYLISMYCDNKYISFLEIAKQHCINPS